MGNCRAWENPRAWALGRHRAYRLLGQGSPRAGRKVKGLGWNVPKALGIFGALGGIPRPLDSTGGRDFQNWRAASRDSIRTRMKGAGATRRAGDVSVAQMQCMDFEAWMDYILAGLEGEASPSWNFDGIAVEDGRVAGRRLA